jgi:hypothetical protein
MLGEPVARFCLRRPHCHVIDAGLMHWLKNYVFGAHFGDWLALAVVVVLITAARIGARRFIFWLLTHKRDKGKDKKEYWRIQGGG